MQPAIAAPSSFASVRWLIAAACAALLLAAGFGSAPARASDDGAKSLTRLAALGENPPAASRRAAPVIDPVRLVQQMLPQLNGSSAHEDLIIVSIDAGKPESLDDDIARDHGLVIVRRFVMSTLGLRLVSCRLVDPQRRDEVVRRLRADDRVSAAQANVAYQPIAPSAAGPRMTNVEPPTRPASRHLEKRHALPGSRAGRPPGDTHGRRHAATAGSLPRMWRSERIAAADVLAGGL